MAPKKLLESQAKYAERHGVTAMAVSKWKKLGWLVFDGHLVDVKASDKNLKKYRSDQEIIQKKQHYKPLNKPDKQEPNQESDFSPDTKGEKELSSLPKSELDRLLTVQKIAKAEYEKREAKWNDDLREGLIVKVEDVERINSIQCLGLRNKLLAIPSEQAIRLANCNDPAQAAEILRDAICDALNDFLREYGIEDE